MNAQNLAACHLELADFGVKLALSVEPRLNGGGADAKRAQMSGALDRCRCLHNYESFSLIAGNRPARVDVGVRKKRLALPRLLKLSCYPPQRAKKHVEGEPPYSVYLHLHTMWNAPHKQRAHVPRYRCGSYGQKNKPTTSKNSWLGLNISSRPLFMWNAPHENFSDGKGRDKNLNVQGICEEFLRNCEENVPIWRELEKNGDKKPSMRRAPRAEIYFLSMLSKSLLLGVDFK